jgi:hypothetical protein
MNTTQDKPAARKSAKRVAVEVVGWLAVLTLLFYGAHWMVRSAIPATGN